MIPAISLRWPSRNFVAVAWARSTVGLAAQRRSVTGTLPHGSACAGGSYRAGSVHLQHIVRRTHERPLPADLLEAPQGEAPKATHVFDLPEHRFGDALGLTASSWGSNNTLVVGRRGNNQGDLALLSMEDEPALELLLESEFNENHAAVSPNGNWIAYASNRSGRYEIYVERFPAFGDRETISTGGGQQPRWSIDGRELFYLGPQENRLMVVAVTTETGLRVGTPETLVEDQFFVFRGRSAYDVAPDG